MVKILLIIILISLLNLSGQNKYQFDHITIKNGLSQSTVYKIIKDSRGFMWFATDYGLNRYDGRNFKIYNSRTTNNQLSNDRIFDVEQDYDGKIWIATEFGINILDVYSNSIKTHLTSTLDPNSAFINDILITKECIWIGTNNGIFKYVRGDNSFLHLLSADEVNISVRSITTDPLNSNILWIGTYQKGLIRYQTGNNSYQEFKVVRNKPFSDISNQINCIEEFKNTLLLGTNGGLFVFDLFNNKTVLKKSLSELGHTFSSDIINYICTINDSTAWIGSWNDGIVVYDGDFNLIENIRHDAANSAGLSHNRVLNIYNDDKDQIWIGTNSRGICVYNQNLLLFQHYLNDAYGSLKFSSNEIWKIFEDNNEILWIGTDNGVSKWDRKNDIIKSFTTNNSVISDNDVFSIIQTPDNLLWFGTRSGIDIFDPLKDRFVGKVSAPHVQERIISNMVLQLIYDKDGYIWAGSFEGLAKIDVKKRRVISGIPQNGGETELTSKKVFSLHENGDGLLWVGTDMGLNLLNKSNLSIVKKYTYEPNIESISDNRIYSILKDENILWLGTFGGGLNKLDINSNLFTIYREYSGLANDMVYGIIEDDEGDLWISTNYGLSRFEKESEKFTNYSIKDGLQAYEFNYGAYAKLTNGELFFGGVNGLNSFNPSEVEEKSEIPALETTDIIVYYSEEDQYSELVYDLSYRDQNTIELNYYQNFFRVNFAILDYVEPEKNYYAYKIKELHHNYINNGNRTSATFTNLAPGEYNLHIIGANSRSIWNREGKALRIIIHPPYWRTWWAYVIYAFLLSGAIFLVLYYRQKILLREIEILEKADRLKSEFLAQMSHEIRSPINVILSFSNLLKNELEENIDEDLKASFESISKAGTRIIRTIDLILNMSEIQTGTYDYKPKRIHLVDDILKNIRDEFKQTAKSKNIELVINCETNDPIIYADEYTIGQIFANLVDNAIKYTDKGSVSVNLVKGSSTGISAIIEDTGKGIKEDYLPYIFSPFTQEEQGYTREFEGNGLGLALVKKYCDINNVEISVQSSFGKGTRFTIDFLN